VTQPITFDVHVDQNEYLPAGATVMDAAISVTAGGALGPAPTAAQVIMIDCSGSMSGTKITEARRATAVAVDTLRDGVAFAIVAGNHEARRVYPPDRPMVAAGTATRNAAKAAVRKLTADGGTAIGTWLELADELLADQDVRIKHGILLTDGHNQHQTPAELRRILERCRGHFVCDSRGVGTGWEAKPLLEIADVLLGSAGGLTEPGELAADFQAITENAMGKAAADVSLRLWTLPNVRVRFLKQIYPRIVDLTDRGSPAGERAVDYPTGQWGAETRDFHLCVELPAGTADEEPIRVAKLSVVAGAVASDERLVRARWTEDPALSTKINARVAHLTGQGELAEVIDAGLAARARGDIETATAKLGRAVQLAEQSGHRDTLQVLSRVVDVIDAPTGTVQLRRKMEQVDAEMAEVVSRTTVRFRQR
jgi:von Willebrand factor type A C-terminal domain/von Willebrand factor type A domain